MKIIYFFNLGLIFFLASCATKIVQIESSMVEIKNEVKFYSDSLAANRSKFKMDLVALKEPGKAIILQDVECGKGEIIGIKKSGSVYTLDKDVNNFRIVCEVKTKDVGDYYVLFKKIYKGDLLIAENLKIVIKAKK